VALGRLGHGARDGGLVLEPRAVAHGKQVAVGHQRLDHVLVAPQRLGGQLLVARGRAHRGQPVDRDERERRNVRQWRTGVVGDGVQLDHRALPIRGRTPLSSAVATELMSARSCT
jgi:hypothetical protein